ncbi:MAG TPA: hypothetical protein V6D37_16205 [Candidatus Sericytochromatia bacterium]|jgi:hypothetical protein
MAGKDAILASSLKTKVQDALSSVLSDTVTAEQSRKLNEPGSSDK